MEYQNVATCSISFNDLPYLAQTLLQYQSCTHLFYFTLLYHIYLTLGHSLPIQTYHELLEFFFLVHGQSPNLLSGASALSEAN